MDFIGFAGLTTSFALLGGPGSVVGLGMVTSLAPNVATLAFSSSILCLTGTFVGLSAFTSGPHLISQHATSSRCDSKTLFSGAGKNYFLVLVDECNLGGLA